MMKHDHLDAIKTMAAKRPIRLLGLTLLAVTSLLYLFNSGRGLRGPSGFGSSLSKLKVPELTNLSPGAKFSSLTLRAQFTDLESDLVEHVDVEIPPFTGTWADANVAALPRDGSVAVRFPRVAPETDASSILFGLATSLDRLDEGLEGFAHWASNNGAHFVVSVSSVDDKHGLTNNGVIDRAASLGLHVTIIESQQNYIERYVSLLENLDPFIQPSTKWISIIDDDTFFPSTNRLLSVLSKYDPTEFQYIGAMSEDVLALQKWGYIAFGGAGIFLSVPLVKYLQPHTYSCMWMDIYSGDAKISECIYHFTTIKLKVEPSLHQLDLFGDFSGFFEAARPLPASLHHWKSWGNYDVVKHGQIAKLTGQDSVYQKFALADGHWMTHGFSIVKFSVDKVDETLSRFNGSMERTFEKLEGETEKTFLHSLAPLRPKDEAKEQYLLEAAVQEHIEDTMSLYYVRREEGVGTGVIRIVWTTK